MKTKAISLVCIFSFLGGCQNFNQTVSSENAIEALKLEKATWSSQINKLRFDNDDWLKNLNDPRLNQYVDIALKNNFSLQANASQLAAQLKNVRISAARLWPSLDFSFRKNKIENETSLSTNNSVDNTSSSASANNVTINSNSSYDTSLNISWEIDLWQRLTAQKKADAKSAQASAEDFQAARLSLVASVARAWFNINSQKLRVDIAEKRLSTIKETLEIVEEQYINGSQSALNVYLNRADYSSQQANILEIKNALHSSIRDFRILLGEYPNIDLNLNAKLPEITQPVPAGLPAELVLRRPDVKADLYEWQATAYDAAAAHRARFPTFSLTASYGASSDRLSTLSDKSLLWNIVNNISQPLFKGGELKARADAAKYLQDASFKLYLSTLLNSFNEVETALSTETNLKQQLILIIDAESLNQSGYELALDQYREGITSYLNLLEAQRRWFDAQTQLINLKNNLLQNRITLNLALGGDFKTKAEKCPCKSLDQDP